MGRSVMSAKGGESRSNGKRRSAVGLPNGCGLLYRYGGHIRFVPYAQLKGAERVCLGAL